MINFANKQVSDLPDSKKYEDDAGQSLFAAIILGNVHESISFFCWHD